MIPVPGHSVRDRTLFFLVVLSLQLAIDGVSAQPANRIHQRADQHKAESKSESLEALRARIAAHLSQPRFAPASWGVKIASLDTGRTIFEHNPEKYFNPASNAKLYTTALALERLGADYRIKTSIYSSVRPDASGTL